jgi:hypothetical protein
MSAMFTDLPTKAGPTLASTLKARPGEWALLGAYSTPNGARSVASDLRRGVRGWAPKGSVEAEVRHVAGEHRVYARWVAA